MKNSFLSLFQGCHGHFQLESGHNGDLWLQLETLCLQPQKSRLRFRLYRAHRLLLARHSLRCSFRRQSPNAHWDSRSRPARHRLRYFQSIFAVPYTVEKNSFVAGKPQLLFDSIAMRFPYSAFDVAADGQHIVAFQFEGGKKRFRTEPAVVLNWLDEVRRQVASDQTAAVK
jgi:hypothetical protein